MRQPVHGLCVLWVVLYPSDEKVGCLPATTLTYVPCPCDVFDGLQLRCSTTMMMATIADLGATTTMMDQGTITLNVSEDTEHWLVTARLTLLNCCMCSLLTSPFRGV